MLLLKLGHVLFSVQRYNTLVFVFPVVLVHGTCTCTSAVPEMVSNGGVFSFSLVFVPKFVGPGHNDLTGGKTPTSGASPAQVSVVLFLCTLNSYL